MRTGSKASAVALSFTLTALLVSCNECDGWFWEDCPDPVTPEQKAALQIKQFRDTASGFAGQNSISVPVLETARAGDLWVLFNGDTAMTSRGGNIFPEPGGQEWSNAVMSESLSGIAASFTWEKKFSTKTSIEFVDLMLDAAFENSETIKVKISLQLTEVRKTQFKQPAELLSEYERVNECIRANCMLSGTVHGRLYLKFEALDRNEKKLELNVETIVAKMNVAAGFTRAEVESTQLDAIIESPESGSVLAATWLRISRGKQDAKWVEEQIQRPNDDVVRSLPLYDTSTGKLVSEVKFRARQDPLSGGAEISLTIYNRDAQQRPITFGYQIWIKDQTFVLLHTAGTVNSLAYCGSEARGVVGVIPRPKNWLLRAVIEFQGHGLQYQ